MIHTYLHRMCMCVCTKCTISRLELQATSPTALTLVIDVVTAGLPHSLAETVSISVAACERERDNS